eukprot:m.112119 g.112119  ORF g.112119 m.112119 type:complete len:490 (+) comp14082_c0_seq1:99-1568(+)
MESMRTILALLCCCLIVVDAESSKKWGVNIHYRVEQAGETAMLAKGFSIARMDTNWGAIESVKGEYNFTDMEILITTLLAHDVTPYLILDYGNPLYDNGLSPYSEEGRSAFTNFSIAMMTRFSGKDIIWEIWNEPNGGFWKPVANATAYAALAVAVGKAKQSNPNTKNEFLVGPAADPGWMDDTPGHWMDVVLSQALQYFDAVSVHPYRSKPPETVVQDYDNLTKLMKKYGDKPLISGEWGYSTCVTPCEPPNFTGNTSDYQQAKYLVRQALINWLYGVKYTIWYDWRNGGTNTSMREEMFGTVQSTYRADNTSYPYEPKQSYLAAVVLHQFAFADEGWEVSRIQQVVSNNTSPNTDPGAYVLTQKNSANPSDIGPMIAWTTTSSPIPNGSCDASYKHEDCGFYGISQKDCESKGCCYETPYKSGPQCYYKPTMFASTLEISGAPQGCYNLYDLFGNIKSPNKVCTASTGVLTIEVTDEPTYLKKTTNF